MDVLRLHDYIGVASFLGYADLARFTRACLVFNEMTQDLEMSNVLWGPLYRRDFGKWKPPKNRSHLKESNLDYRAQYARRVRSYVKRQCSWMYSHGNPGYRSGKLRRCQEQIATHTAELESLERRKKETCRRLDVARKLSKQILFQFDVVKNGGVYSYFAAATRQRQPKRPRI